MSSTTKNLNLVVDQATEETTFNQWRSDVNDNFKKVDSKYVEINTNIDTATTGAADWETKVSEITAENTNIYTVLANKVNKETEKSLVDDTLITKLETDYSKDEVDATFVTKETLQNTIIKQEDINLNNYYTKAEVNGLVTGGSTEALKDYYTKEEVDDKLVGDADIQKIIDYLDALNGYELSMKELDALNGNGE